MGMCAFFYVRSEKTLITISKNEFEVFEWSSHDELNGRLGIISNEIESPVLESIKQKMKSKGQTIFRITTIDPKLEQQDELNIIEFEQIPAASNDETGFSNTRMNWVQQYLSLLSYINKKDRKEFIPTASFRAHVEGPLIGYIRANDTSYTSDNKDKLSAHFKKLNNIKWYMTEDGEMVYHVSGNSEEELLESLFIGAWSFWSFTPHIVGETPINLIMELEGSFMEFPVLNEKRAFISFVSETLSRLTFDLQMSYIVKTQTFFPIPESLVEHILLEYKDTKDMNWNELSDFPKEINTNEVIWLHNHVAKLMEIDLHKEKSYDTLNTSE